MGSKYWEGTLSSIVCVGVISIIIIIIIIIINIIIIIIINIEVMIMEILLKLLFGNEMKR